MADIVVKKENFYYQIKLNRPEKHNAFTPGMIKELTEFFLAAEKDKFSGAIVLSGAGPSFCAGGDLEWMKSSVQWTLEQNLEDARALFRMFEVAQNCTLPIIGYMQGNVFGGGLGLAAICDVGISEFSTRFCFSEVKLGLAPAVISSFVTNKMLPNRARQLMITGKIFDAMTAYEAGLVEFVGRELEAKEYLKETLQLIGKNGPEAVRSLKNLLNQMRLVPSTKIADVSTRLIAERRVSGEGQEGIRSFLEKRTPAWVWAQNEEE